MALRRTVNELVTIFEMGHFLMPILTPNFKEWSNLTATLFAPTQYSFEIRFKRPHAMNSFGDVRENRILTLPIFYPKGFNG